MGRTKPWELSDEFWELARPLIPPPAGRERRRTYRRKPGGGRKPKDARTVLAAVLYVLRTGCQWKALPKERFGSASAVHAHFRRWARAGFFVALWRAGLAEHDAMEGIAWEWQSVDAALVKAPPARESVGPNPTGRGKKWEQAARLGRRPWGPALPRRHRGEPAGRETGGGGVERGGGPAS